MVGCEAFEIWRTTNERFVKNTLFKKQLNPILKRVRENDENDKIR
jgi:hypothetical protein